MRGLCLSPLCLTLAFGALAERPQLQIINGSETAITIHWLKPDGEKVSSGAVASGENRLITTTLGHRFLIANGEAGGDRTVTAELAVQAYRYPSVPVDLPDNGEILSPPPAGLALPECYTQCLSARGFPIAACASVSPFALKEAAHLTNQMLDYRPDVRSAMVRSGARMCINGHNQFTTDLPESSALVRPAGYESLSDKDYWDARARGTGGSRTDPVCTCGEENLLGYAGDPYSSESIFIHEFAHNIHLRGLVNVDPTFDRRLKQAYQEAMAKGLWAGKYPSVNHHEYFAEGVQSWFDDNRENDHDHNHVNTRAELIDYDRALADLCREVFGETILKYTKPATRLTGHLAGYDPAKAPTFAWPARLQKARELIRQRVQLRSVGAQKGPASTSAAPVTQP